MKKRLWKGIAVLAACIIALSCLTSVMGFAEEDAQALAIERLKEAWSQLGKEVSELYAVPGDNDRLTVDETVAEQMKRPNCAVGPYYMHKKLNWNTEYAPAGAKYYDMSDKEDLTFRFVYRLTKDAQSENSVNGSSFCFQVTGQDGKTVNNFVGIWTDKTDFRVAQFSFNGENNKNMGTGGIKNIKVAPNKGSDEAKNADYMQMGCIYAYYTQRVALPENTDGWDADRWIDAAESLSLEGYNTAAFEEALTALREFSVSGKAYNALIAAWNHLQYTAYEPVAVPKSTLYDTDESVREKMGIDAGIAIGEKYTRFAFGNALYFTPADGTGWSQKDLSKYSKLYYYIRSFSDEQYTAYDKGSYFVNYYINKVPGKTGYPNVEKGKVKLVTYKPTEKGLTNIELKRNGSNGKYVMVTSVMGEYTALKDFPEHGRLLSLRRLVQAAEAVDLTGVSEENVTLFREALAAAKDSIPEIFIDTAAVDRAKTALVEAWSALSCEERTVWAVPAEPTRRETDAEAENLTGVKAENLGPYYVLADLTADTISFVPPDGKDAFDSLANSQKITGYTAFFTADMKKAKAGDGVFVFQFDSSVASYPNNYSSSFSLTANSQKGAFAKYFSGTKPGSIRVFKETSSKANTVAMGCIYSVQTVKAKLPYRYEDMSLPLLVDYARKTDIAKFDAALQSAFTQALETASGLSDKMRQAAMEKLLKLAGQAGLTLNEDSLIADAMAADLTAVPDPSGILAALYTLRLYTEEGFQIDRLKTAWEDLGAALPERYAQRTVEEWIQAAKALSVPAGDAVLIKRFQAALRNLIYYFTGVVDTSELSGYVNSALTMRPADFTKLTWETFEAQLNRARALIADPSQYTQADADAAVDTLLEAWGQLKYYDRSLYLDVSDYYKNDATVKVSTKFKEEDTFQTLEKNLTLSNGLDCATKVSHISKGDTFQYGGQELISLKGFDYLEFYVKLDKDFVLASNGQLAVQLMCKGGREWFDYYVTLPKSWVGGDWQKIEIPVNEFKNYKNGKRQKDVLLTNTESKIMTVKVFMNSGSGTLYFSSMSAAKECAVTAGVVPTIPKIKLDRPPVIKRPAPKNPFVGVDRGDPWGDEYRANLKPTIDEPNDDPKKDVIQPEKPKKTATVYVLAGIGALLLAGAGAAAVWILLKKKKNGGEEP